MLYAVLCVAGLAYSAWWGVEGSGAERSAVKSEEMKANGDEGNGEEKADPCLRGC